MTGEDDFDTETVGELLGKLRARNFKSTDKPTGSAIWIPFEISYEQASRLEIPEGRYRLEVNVESGNLWLHYDDGDESGTETVWENKQTRY